MMMDHEFGSNSSCVILSLMGLDERPIKKHVQGHKRVLSDEYHQRVAFTASHVRRSSLKRYSAGMSKNRVSSESFVEICHNKLCSTSTEDDALGVKGFVDELVSETYSSRNATRQCFEFVHTSKPSTSFAGRYSFNGSSSASSFIYRRRDSEKGNEALHQRSYGVSNAMHHGEVHRSISERSNLEGIPLEHDSDVELLSQKSPAKISSVLEDIEQETAPKVSVEPFDDEKATELSEDGERHHSCGFDPSKARSGETKTTVSADEARKDHCKACCSEQDMLKPIGICGNREFNYLVDILTAADFCRKNLMSNFDKWHSVEYPLSPSIFEVVEKRYADDKSWEVSERLLLFDRINSRLEGVLSQSMLVSSRHVSVRISHQFCQHSEDVLWRSLVKEARELKGEMIEDLVERDLGSLEVGGLIEAIVTEIERAAIDKLTAELVE